MTGVILAMVIVGVTGCLIGFFLCIASEKFKVETDPREDAIIEVLPGNNCGGCGYAGCSGLAAAIVAGEAAVNQCPVGGTEVGAQIGEIMGVESGYSERRVAFVRCSGNCEKAVDRYDYQGVEECTSMYLVPGGGPKACTYGCMGFGSCVRACPFDAIHIVDGIAVVDRENCKGCEKCAITCPRHLIEMIPYDSAYAVSCASKGSAKEIALVCKAGCIGCHLCEKNCPTGAITVTDNIAHINQTICTGCGACAAKCPKKVIIVQNAEKAKAAAS